MTEIFKARGAWKDDDNWEPRLLHPAKLCTKIKGEKKTFHDKNRLKESMATKPVLQKYQKEYFNLKRRINTPKSSQMVNTKFQNKHNKSSRTPQNNKRSGRNTPCSVVTLNTNGLIPQ